MKWIVPAQPEGIVSIRPRRWLAARDQTTSQRAAARRAWGIGIIVIELYPKGPDRADTAPKTAGGFASVGKSLQQAYCSERDTRAHLPKTVSEGVEGAWRTLRVDGKISLDTFTAEIHVPMSEDDPTGRMIKEGMLQPRSEVAAA